jgi:cytochrome P450
LVAAASNSKDQNTSRTIVHEIIDSKLPVAEKTFERVFDDVATVTGAGFETIGNALRLIFYHVFANEDILQKLREELSSVANPSGTIDLKVVE